ncbi:MAG: prepilin-type N-terminal cleavage/methylation domain-containing protein [bacterium]|jgi:type II secretion system protein G
MIRQGFTLIELLIVVAIIGILAAIAVPNFLNAQTRAKVARVRADVHSLTTALEQYRLDNNDYPRDMGGPNQEEQRSWAQLTTPVAYISSTEVCKDPFTNSGQGAVGSGFANVRTYYDYGGGTWHDHAPGSSQDLSRRAVFERSSGAGFVILSFGPNKAREFPWSDQSLIGIGRRTHDGLQYVYNSSNGLTSLGDIFATSGGPVE